MIPRALALTLPLQQYFDRIGSRVSRAGVRCTEAWARSQKDACPLPRFSKPWALVSGSNLEGERAFGLLPTLFLLLSTTQTWLSHSLCTAKQEKHLIVPMKPSLRGVVRASEGDMKAINTPPRCIILLRYRNPKIRLPSSHPKKKHWTRQPKISTAGKTRPCKVVSGVIQSKAASKNHANKGTLN